MRYSSDRKGYDYPTVLTLCSGRGVGRGCPTVLWAIQKYSIRDALHLIRAKGVRRQPSPPPRPYFLRGKEHISLAGSQQIELSGSLSVDFGYACQKISESVLPLIPPPHFCLCECVFISGQFQIFDKGLSIKSKKKFFKNISTSIAT